MSKDTLADIPRLAFLNSESRKKKKSERRSSQGYSRFVRAMRIILPMIAMMVAGSVFLWSDSEDKKIKPASIEELQISKEDIKNELLNPKFEGVDKSGRPFTVTADRATQQNDIYDTVVMESPEAVILLDDEKKVTISSVKGTYSQTEREMTLENNVKAEHDSGYIFKTEQATAYLKERLLKSESKVSASGKEADLTASGMIVDINKNTLKFTGPIEVKINSSFVFN